MSSSQLKADGRLEFKEDTVDWVGLSIFGLTIAFFAGIWIMSVRALQKRVEAIEDHNKLQDRLIAETHTTSEVILTKLDYISESIAELREEHRKNTCGDWKDR